MYRPVLVTPPAAPIVSLAEAKAHLRIDGSDDDALVIALVAAAEGHFDGWTGVLGRALVTQTWRQDFDAFCRNLHLPLAPVASITSVTYEDAAGITQTVDSGSYRLLTDDRGPYVRMADGFSAPSLAPAPPAVHVTYVAGYGAGSDVPAPIRAAILLQVGDLYENREATIVGTIVTPNPTSDRLISPFRRVWF